MFFCKILLVFTTNLSLDSTTFKLPPKPPPVELVEEVVCGFALTVTLNSFDRVVFTKFTVAVNIAIISLLPLVTPPLLLLHLHYL